MRTQIFLVAAWTFSLCAATAQQVPRRPQEPKPPFPYKSIEVTFQAPDGATVAGLLTAPASGTHPAVLLIPGSGPNDRDSTLAGHKPFLVLADHLTRQGYVVLRTDSRGVGKSTGSSSDCSGDVLAADALAAVRFLRGRPEVAGQSVGLIGHSLGGGVAAIAAAQGDAVDWVVLLSASGRVDLDNSSERLASMLAEKKTPQAEIDRVTALVGKVTGNPDAPDVRPGLRELTVLMAGDMVPADRIDTLVDSQITSMRSPCGRFWIRFDPAVAMARVKCPVLAISGSLDRALSAEKNLRRIHETLREAGNQDVTVVELFGVNHLMQTARTGAMTEFAEIEETLSPQALALITGWLDEHADRYAGELKN